MSEAGKEAQFLRQYQAADVSTRLAEWKDTAKHESDLRIIAEARLAEVQAEVREWLCAKCNTVYPGPPQEGVWCVVCPRCGGDTGLRNAMELRAARTRLAEVERERDEARQYANMVDSEQQFPSLRSQLTQAREALETMDYWGKQPYPPTVESFVLLARQALATINEGETG